jgi:amino acid transporter
MSYFVAVTALLGILTSLLVSLYSVARLVMVASRDWLLPPQLARVSARTQTPLAAQAAVGGAVAAVALLVAFVELSQLVSFGTLFAMWMVCNTLLFRRFYPDVKLRFTRYGTVEATQSASLRRVPGAALGERARRALVVGHLAAINALSIGEWRVGSRRAGLRRARLRPFRSARG